MTVTVWKSQAEFQRAYNALPGGTESVLAFCAQVAGTPIAEIAQVHFCRLDLRPSTIAHEFAHAVFFWCRERKIIPERNSESQEKFCGTLDKLLDSFYDHIE